MQQKRNWQADINGIKYVLNAVIAKNDWIRQIARNTTENCTARPAMDEDLVPKESDLALVQVPCPWIL